jgi:hypothetical protein
MYLDVHFSIPMYVCRHTGIYYIRRVLNLKFSSHNRYVPRVCRLSSTSVSRRTAMPPFLPPHILHRRRSVTATRLPSPLVLDGYQPDFTSSVYNRDSENSTSDDIYTPDSSAVGYSILNGRALLIILQSIDLIPPPSRSASFSSFNSTGFPQDKYTALLHANQKLETDNLLLKGRFDALQ